ncbi:hypothetical protein SNEBB_003365 [Seison nebaliae]|nr:hypothetical protein SNEBB_003365 [Seison nebaliae]
MEEQLKFSMDNISVGRKLFNFQCFENYLVLSPLDVKSDTIKHIEYSAIKTLRTSKDVQKMLMKITLQKSNDINMCCADKTRSNERLKLFQNTAKFLTEKIEQQYSIKIDDYKEKKKILQDNLFLLNLYKTLVGGKVMTAKDFWKHYETNETVKHNDGAKTTKDNRGFPTGFLAEIKIGPDNAFHLTDQIMNLIYKLYPEVHKKYQRSVVEKKTISHMEFWTEFLQSHFFYKDLTSKSTFFEESNFVNDQQLEIIEDYAHLKISGIDKTDIREAYHTEDDEKKYRECEDLGIPSNDNIIQRTNYQSLRILEASEMDNKLLSEGTDVCDELQKECEEKLSDKMEIDEDNGNPNELSNVEKGNEMEYLNYMNSFDSAMLYALNTLDTNDLNEWKKSVQNNFNTFHNDIYDENQTDISIKEQIKLSDVIREEYLPEKYIGKEVKIDESTKEYLMNYSNSLNELKNYRNRINDENSCKLLTEMNTANESFDYSLVRKLNNEKEDGDDDDDDEEEDVFIEPEKILSKEDYKKYVEIYSAFLELARHFWSCFPAFKSFRSKLTKMREHLVKFETTILADFEQRMLSEYDNEYDFTAHLRLMLSRIYNRYNQYEEIIKNKYHCWPLMINDVPHTNYMSKRGNTWYDLGLQRMDLARDFSTLLAIKKLVDGDDGALVRRATSKDF